MLSELNEAGRNKVLKDVKRLAEKDTAFPVRAAAISALAETYKLNEKKIYEAGWDAMSYEVNSEALLAMSIFNRDESLALARKTLANSLRNEMYLACWQVLAKNGTAQDLNILTESVLNSGSQWRNYGLVFIGRYGVYHPAQLSNNAIDKLVEIYSQNPSLKQRCKYVLFYMKTTWTEQLESTEDKALKKELESRLAYLQKQTSSL